MRCTTNLDFIPSKDHPKPKSEELQVDTTFEVEVKEDLNPFIKVYEQGVGWRGFRADQVITWEMNND